MLRTSLTCCLLLLVPALLVGCAPRSSDRDDGESWLRP